MPTAIIAGDSHTVCLGVPLFTEDGSPKLVSPSADDPRFLGVTGALRRDDRYWNLIAENGAGRKIAIFWLGNQHLTGHLFAETPGYDLFVERLPDLRPAPGLHIVPENAIRALFAPSFVDLREVIKRLQSANCEPVVCGTPPPKGNNELLRHCLAKEGFFIQLAASMGVDLKVIELSSPTLRFKLWTVLQSMMEEVASELGCPFAPIPPATQTPDGFLRQEYWALDVTHANAAYGKLVLEHLSTQLNLH
jgi:hypothetical protein